METVPVSITDHPDEPGVPHESPGARALDAPPGEHEAVPRLATLTAVDADAMHRVGIALGGLLTAGDVVLLRGPLGAGKTTLTRGIGEGLGVRGPVTSPTFVLARTHPSRVGGAPLIHVDAYRLQDSAELEDLDLDVAHSVVVAEWGDGLFDPGENWLHIDIARPVGGAAAAVGGAAGGGGAAGRGGAASGGGAADTDASDEVDEPRLLTVTGYGPRWAHLLPGAAVALERAAEEDAHERR